MPSPEPHLAALNQWIAAVYGDLAVCRACFDDSPSGGGASSCEAAENRLNELLHQRFTATQGSGSCGRHQRPDAALVPGELSGSAPPVARPARPAGRLTRLPAGGGAVTAL